MMRHAKIAFAWFLTNFTMLAGTSTHFLDIDELKSIHYDIDILEKPVLYGRPLHTEVVYLSSKFGQRYECQLPDVADVGKVQDEEKTAAETGISDLLKPMELAPCLLKSKDWWTYEFCYGKHVRQFHMDNNKISGEVITIGVFESEMDWENKSHSAAKRHRLNRYHSHRYVNGSNCDLTGKPREAEVRFLCAENELDTMSRIDEPESCRYVITVHTMRICHHPYLKPPAKAKPKTILCFPLLMQDQYDQYMHQQTKHRYSKEAQEIGNIPDDGDGEEGITQDPDVDYDYDDDDDDDDLELLEEHHLHGDLSASGPDEVIAGEGGEVQVTDLLITEVLKRVQGTIDKINSQLEDDKQSGQDGEGGDPEMMVGKTGQDRDEEMEDNDDDNDDYEEEEEDDEFMELLKMDYKELIKYIRELPTGHREEAKKLAKLAQEIEDSFEYIEAMEIVLDQIQGDMSDISPPVEDPMLSAEDPLDEVSDGPVTVLETNMKDDMEGEGLVKEEKEEDEEELMQELKEEEGQKEKKEDLEHRLTDTLNKLMRQMKEKVNFKGEATSAESKVSPQSESGDLSSRVRVRVTRVKLDKNQKASSEQELKFLDTDHQDIEQAIADQLEKSGLNKDGGGQLEVRILSYVPEEWPDQGIEDEGFAVLSEEDSSYFRNMIFGLVMKDDAEVQSRQERLQRNYGFQWDADSDLDQSQVTDMGVEQEEVHILIPKIGTKESSQGQTSSDPEH